jgi:hypothetical protein
MTWAISVVYHEDARRTCQSGLLQITYNVRMIRPTFRVFLIAAKLITETADDNMPSGSLGKQDRGELGGRID